MIRMERPKGSVSKSGVREKILEVGLEVMHAHGFNGCSVQDITEAAGVPKGSFYHYFDSKEALTVEVLGIYGGAGARTLALDTNKTALERLRNDFKGASRVFKAAGFERGCLMGKLASELSDSSEAVREALAQRFAQWHRAIADVLREGQSSGEVNRNIDADQMARFLINSWEGALIQMKVSKSSQPIDDFLKLAFISLQLPATCR